VGRLVDDDNVHRAVFDCGFFGIIVRQCDVPAIVWTAAGAPRVTAIMSAATWVYEPASLRRRPKAWRAAMNENQPA
jgi:hypothetical protein